MDRYLAVVKMASQPQACKISFEAPSIGQAIDSMCKAMNLTTTVAIEEFEILKLMDNNHYMRVASKNKREERVVQRTVESTVVGPLVTTDKQEAAFTPYTIKAA